MIVYIDQLKEKYKDYSDIGGKISRLIHAENIFPLVKGIYETDGKTDGMLLASAIYGPSYLSFEYALYYYGMIPEAMFHTYTSATFDKRKKKAYKNHFGSFYYRDIPKAVASYGISYHQIGNYSYIMASKEKALCDKLYIMPPVHNLKELKAMLFEDLRIDEQIFESLDKTQILSIAPLYHKKNLDLLCALVRKSLKKQQKHLIK